MSKYYARLFPYSPREGFNVRNFTAQGVFFRGGARPAWYQISEVQKEALSAYRQNPSDKYSKPLFQFATPDQMEQVEQQERAQLVAASMLSRGAIIDPDVVPKTRVIDVSSTPTGGRAAAIPQTRDSRPESVKTATYQDEGIGLEIAPQVNAAPSKPKLAPPILNKAIARRRARNTVRADALKEDTAPALAPKPLEQGGPISSSDLK